MKAVLGISGDAMKEKPQGKSPGAIGGSVQRVVSLRSSPSQEAVQYADYILNHYSRISYADKLCLARDLERHGWKRKRQA